MTGYPFTRMDKWVMIMVTVAVFPFPQWLLILLLAAVLGAIEGVVIAAWANRKAAKIRSDIR